MVFLFLVFIAVWFFILFRFQKTAMIFGIINLILLILMLMHHATDTLKVRL
ncbi:MAG: hypothetical protein K1X28_07165 [Parachlamydiales bacterium]|nr:hypothetical protein [Parachlamydiales bacterium]